ncbi:short chain acyl-coenzyme A dehydrogenase, partial [Lentinula raphanica]
TQIEVARLLMYNATLRKEAGLSFAKEQGVGQEISAGCNKWPGGLLGFTKTIRGGEVWRVFEDCKIGAIYEGSFDIQLQSMFIQMEYTSCIRKSTLGPGNPEIPPKT